MRQRIVGVARALWDRMPDFRDLHIYGGLVLFAVAGFYGYGYWPLMTCGAVLFYLGVWRLG